VAAARLQAIGMGEREPLAPNDKDYGRALNRRIEIYLRGPGTAP
jgi:flagellar motor protein MotB